LAGAAKKANATVQAILDMKGGNYIALDAVRQLRRAAIATPLPISILLTNDEDVGTPGLFNALY
jgi:acetylornithine deacetylase/succinyl-diaminopimelate desuccinylase-like protein